MRVMGLVGCVLLFAASAAAEIDVPLTVVERGGVERVNEPITCGVPFPKGALTDADLTNLVLVGPDGRPVPMALTVATRWYPDTSVKWLHLDFQPSVKAKGTAVYTLKRGTPARVTDGVTATQKDGVVTVVTGPLKFTVNRARFRLFDEVWVDETGQRRFDETTRIVAPSKAAGIRTISSHMGLKKNKVYTADRDDTTTVEIEEVNPMRAVIKVTGAHVSTDDLAGPKVLLDYTLRLYAWRGSTTVNVVYTVMHKRDTRIHAPVPVDGMAIDIETDLGGALAYHLGKPGGAVTGDLGQGERAYVEVTGSDRHVFGGAAATAGEGTCKSMKPMPTDLGWVCLTDGTRAVGLGIHRFWQLWPKAVEADADGRLVAHLWPRLDGQALQLPKQDEKTEPWNQYWRQGVDYPIEKALRSRLMPGRAHFFLGMSKTHEMMVTFQSRADVAAVRRAWYGLERPLRAVCPTSWYCQQTRAFGTLADSSPGLFAPAVHKAITAYDARLRDWLDWLIRFRGKDYGKTYGVYDQYGMFDFGCSINYERMKGRYKKPDEAKPVSFHWDNNYYDFPHACVLQFARTGDLDFLETAREADRHCIDIDIVCAHPQPAMVGAPRYCPGRMHICDDSKGIYVSNTYNHFKNLCHFDMWYLFRDHHFRDRGYLQADFVVRRGRASLSQARSIGHGIRGALAAYRASGKPKYLEAARRLVNYSFTRTGSGSWQDGIALEGFRELYEQTGDERLVRTILNGAAASMAKKDYAPAILHAYGFAYAMTGDATYRDVLLKRLPRVGRARTMWGSVQSFGNTLRNAPYMFWYVSNLPPTDRPRKPKPVP